MVDVKEAPINKIFEGTQKLIEAHGYNEVKKEDIARETGISVNLLDKYFPDGKVAILKGIIQKQSVDFFDKVDFNYVTIDNLAGSLKYLLKLYLKLHYENTALLAAMERAFLSNKAMFKGYEDIFTIELTAAPLVAQVLRHFGFKEGKNFDDFVSLIIHTLDSLVHRHVIYSKIVEDDNVLIDYLISLSVGFINYSVQFRNEQK